MGSILSGLASGIIGVIATLYAVSREDARQEENLKMQAKQELQYKGQLDWYNRIREAVAVLVKTIIAVNKAVNELNTLETQIKQRSDDKLAQVGDVVELIKMLSERREFAAKELPKLNKLYDEFNQAVGQFEEQKALVKLYLFHDDSDEQELIQKMDSLTQYYDKEQPVPLSELNTFVEFTRSFLKAKTAGLYEQAIR